MMSVSVATVPGGSLGKEEGYPGTHWELGQPDGWGLLENLPA